MCHHSKALRGLTRLEKPYLLISHLGKMGIWDGTKEISVGGKDRRTGENYSTERSPRSIGYNVE